MYVCMIRVFVGFRDVYTPNITKELYLLSVFNYAAKTVTLLLTQRKAFCVII